MKRLLAMIFLFASLATMYADGVKGGNALSATHEPDSVITETFSIHYVFDRIDIDTAYLDNRRQIAHIREYLHNSPRIDSITIYAWASPEGAYHHNVWLARERAKTAKRFLLRNSPDSLKLDEGKIKISPLAENWPGLEALVEQNYTRHDRDRVLKILRTQGIGDETRKWRLQQLDGGYTWRYLMRNYMPQLRAATWICVWAEVIDPLPAVAQLVDRPSHDAGPAPVPMAVREEEAPRTIAALKTNLLYDAVTAVNLEVEFPIGERWSVAFEDVCPWWTWGPNKNKYAFQLLELGIEPRYWFRKNPDVDRLAGHFVGVYAMSGMYDFQHDRALCYQGEAWSAGVTYGYSLPLNDWLNMEFSASLGYMRSDYRHYQPDLDYKDLYRDPYLSGKVSYFGPTKLKVSLVLPIRTRSGRGGRI